MSALRCLSRSKNAGARHVAATWAGAASLVFMLFVAGCIFSPAKSGGDFALSARVWDGVELDSAGHKSSLKNWVRLHFNEEGEVEVQVGKRKGSAPFAVRSSGRMSLGFEDEPLRLGTGEPAFNARIEALLPLFLAKVDRYREEGGKLYLKTSAYPDMMVTLMEGDTSKTVGQVDTARPPVKPPDSNKVVPPETTVVVPPSNTLSFKNLTGKVWTSFAIDSAAAKMIPASRLVEIRFYSASEFSVTLPCSFGKGSYAISDSRFITFNLFQFDESRCSDKNSTVPAHLKALSNTVLPVFQARNLTLLNGETLYLTPLTSPITLVLTANASGLPPLENDLPPVFTPPIDPAVDTTLLYYLPLDFPVYGGRRVPAERVGLYRDAVAAWERWKVSQIIDYTFNFEETCFCLNNRNGNVTVRVGAVTGFVGNLANARVQPELSELPTVESLFAQIGLLLTKSVRLGETVKINYGIFGEPTAVSANMIPETQEDDFTFTVTRLNPLRVVTTFPTLPMDQLLSTAWQILSLEQSGVLTELAKQVSVKFNADGTWKGTFGCNTYGGHVEPQPDGRYVLTLDYQTYFECGESQATDMLEALIQNPVVLQAVGENLLQISSTDGLLQAVLRTLPLVLPR